MNKTQTIKEYSSKKLKEIIEKQSNAYNSNFINHAKDELIKRGESFDMDIEFEKSIKTWSDEDLKNIVENEYDNYHLEYLEIGRKEYLKRGFINETIEENEQDNKFEEKYPALRSLSSGYYIYAWIVGLTTIGIILYLLSISVNIGIIIATLILGITTILGLLAVSEAIIVFVDIEENTRKHS